MKALDCFQEPLAVVILNASRDPFLRAARAKTLHDAGYYTSSARTPDEAIALAGQMRCAVAILCSSFSAYEQRLIHAFILERVPRTTVIFLGESADSNPHVLLSAVRAALNSQESVGYRAT